MTPAPFPFIGVVAPLAVAGLVWFVTGSTFALLGAVIAPTMVIAHYVDGVRRSVKEARRVESVRARESAVEREAKAVRDAQRVADENRSHPSIADIARNLGWVPARNGHTLVRAGHRPDGSPWLVDVSAGVSVGGEGPVADAVWLSLMVHATAQLGDPSDTGNPVRWTNGSSIVRGESRDVAQVIRCSDHAIVSVTTRGSIPAVIDVLPDEVSGADEILCAMSQSNRPQLNVSLTSETPHVLIAGRTGSGKSCALTTLVVAWASRHPPTEFQFVGFDFKGGATLDPLRGLPHHIDTLTDLTAADVPRAMFGIAAEMRRRETEFARQRVASIESASGVPRLAIVIDEVHELLRQFPDVHDLLADIARRGRSLGVHLVLAVQHPSGVVRESVLGNISVRICLAMNTVHDVVQVLGRATPIAPTRGRALITCGDGLVHEVDVPPVEMDDMADLALPQRPAPLWLPALSRPLARDGRPGFGIVDDVSTARYRIADWQPSDGDVAVIGDRGSGRTEVLRALVDGRSATWARSARDLEGELGIVVIDNLNHVLDSMQLAEATSFMEAIRRIRHGSPAVVVLVSSDQSLPRAIGPMRNVITLRTANLDAHRATGAPAETFDPASEPGVGTWRGLRFVLYARTDSSDTDSSP